MVKLLNSAPTVEAVIPKPKQKVKNKAFWLLICIQIPSAVQRSWKSSQQPKNFSNNSTKSWNARGISNRKSKISISARHTTPTVYMNRSTDHTSHHITTYCNRTTQSPTPPPHTPVSPHHTTTPLFRHTIVTSPIITPPPHHTITTTHHMSINAPLIPSASHTYITHHTTPSHTILRRTTSPTSSHNTY